MKLCKIKKIEFINLYNINKLINKYEYIVLTMDIDVVESLLGRKLDEIEQSGDMYDIYRKVWSCLHTVHVCLQFNFRFSIFGGAIRDLIQGIVPHDIDVMVTKIRHAERFEYILCKEFDKAGLKYQVQENISYLMSEKINEMLIAEYKDKVEGLTGYLDYVQEINRTQNQSNTRCLSSQQLSEIQNKYPSLFGTEERRKEYQFRLQKIYDETSYPESHEKKEELDKEFNDIMKTKVHQPPVDLTKLEDFMKKVNPHKYLKTVKIWKESNPDLTYQVDIVVQNNLLAVQNKIYGTKTLIVDFDVNTLSYNFYNITVFGIQEEFHSREERVEYIKQVVKSIHEKRCKLVGYAQEHRIQKMQNYGYVIDFQLQPEIEVIII